jgi:hypothetical protein
MIASLPLGNTIMVLAPVFKRQNISLASYTKQRLRASAYIDQLYGIAAYSRSSVTIGKFLSRSKTLLSHVK